MKRLFPAVLIVFVALVLLLALKPVSNPSLANSEQISAKVVAITEDGGPGDIVFKLDNSNKRFYINRGTHRGLNIVNLRQTLMHHKIDIFYFDRWTPLDPLGMNRHITRITNNGEIIYDEIASTK